MTLCDDLERLLCFPSCIPAAPGAEVQSPAPNFCNVTLGSLSATQSCLVTGKRGLEGCFSSHPVCSAHARRCSGVSVLSGGDEKGERERERDRIEGIRDAAGRRVRIYGRPTNANNKKNI